MKTALYFFSMVIVGIIAGALSFSHLMDRAITATGVRNGPWITNTAYGDRDAPALLKAGVAMRGLFALKSSETVYYTAYTDSNGEPLSDGCTYRVRGAAPATRWWSFTLYGDDNFLIANDANIYSVFMDPESRVVDFTISPQQPRDDADWLPSGNGGAVSVTLRLYNPASTVYEALDTTPLPSITREDCS
ncbi:DUF1214 domain-containing protein [Parvularcula sp. IMCC14364]|uniref:DUF1214 domain-containing protein n=1 Tax=Parvularcula sp. IMCC14364 TaxID=3067902 RepID=UPI002740C25C|nr:DUF1214 domain-containing protein [Parvularcula sp. IMCC14364]